VLPTSYSHNPRFAERKATNLQKIFYYKEQVECWAPENGARAQGGAQHKRSNVERGEVPGNPRPITVAIKQRSLQVTSIEIESRRGILGLQAARHAQTKCNGKQGDPSEQNPCSKHDSIGTTQYDPTSSPSSENAPDSGSRFTKKP
jgi:hypothetical protein